MIGIRRGIPLIKAWSIVGHPPEGPTVFTNPPESHFRPDGEMDIPAFAHNGRGQHIEGQFDVGEHGEHVYRTALGDFRHGIDAVAHHLGEFLKARGIPVPAIDVINNAIKHSNATHSNLDKHEQNPFHSIEWRKMRGNALPPGDSTHTTNNRPVRTHSGNKITMLTNKNHEATPMGRFLESYYVPFNKSLLKELTDMGIPESDVKQALPFTKYPYIYANMTAPEGYLRSYAKQHPSEVDSSMMSHAPEGYYGDRESVHTWEVAHHLPDIFYYPNLKANLQKKGKAPTKLYQAAHAMIDQAMQQGLEHIPNVEVVINRGKSLAEPDMIQRPLHEILQIPDLREALVRDMAHVPAMMFLFGRSGQGDFHKLYNHMMSKYGADEGSLSLDEHAKYLKEGEKGGQGMHTSAKRLFALARASGEGSEEGRSRFGEHKITADELKAANVHYSDPLMLQVDRFRNVIEALADHQASARGHDVKRGLGDIPTEPMKTYNIHGYPMMDEATGQYNANTLEPHMDDYIYQMHHFAPTGAFDPGLSPTVPTGSETPPVPTTTEQGPPAGVASALPPQPVGTPPRFQDVRHQIAGYNPAQFREMMQAAGRAPVARPVSPELSPVESRAQAALADPRQRLLSQYYKSNDVMDSVMALLKRRR